MVKYLALTLLAASAIAQTPQQPTPSRATQMAMQALAEELMQVNKDFAAVNEQVKKDLPGYHIDDSLKIVKDEPPHPEVKAEPKK